MSKRVSNREAHAYVERHEPFKGSNTWAEWAHNRDGVSRYVVYSYGEHWPLFIYEEGKWYENADKYSRSTSKHRSQLHPLCETEKHSAEDMVKIANHGIAGWMRRKLAA